MQLHHIKYSAPVPFQIEITAPSQTGSTSTLECLEILRLLPGRRLVCRANLQGQTVIAKLFIHPGKSATDHKQELAGYNFFVDSKITTPKLISSGSITNSGLYVLYEFIDEATPLEKHIAAKPNSFSLTYITELMPIIAKMHSANIQQMDLHLNNFLIQQDGNKTKLYTIDCGDVSVLNEAAEKRLLQINKNIADILSQLPIIYDQYLSAFLISYQQASSIKQAANQAEICNQIKEWRKWRINNYLKKANRNCSEFIHEKNWHEMRVYKRKYSDKEWQTFYSRLDALVENSPRLKDGNTATVALAKCQGNKIVIKRYNIKNIRHWLGRFWRPSRGWVTWQNAHQLAVLGIKTPEPIAIIEQRFGWLRYKAFYISRYDPAVDALTEYTKGAEVTDEHIEDFRELFTAMIYSQLSHGDLKANNILLSENGLSLIDLDAMQIHANPQRFKKAFSRDLKRFMKNWPTKSKAHMQFKQLLDKLPTQPVC